MFMNMHDHHPWGAVRQGSTESNRQPYIQCLGESIRDPPFLCSDWLVIFLLQLYVSRSDYAGGSQILSPRHCTQVHVAQDLPFSLSVHFETLIRWVLYPVRLTIFDLASSLVNKKPLEHLNINVYIYMQLLKHMAEVAESGGSTCVLAAVPCACRLEV